MSALNHNTRMTRPFLKIKTATKTLKTLGSTPDMFCFGFQVFFLTS